MFTVLSGRCKTQSKNHLHKWRRNHLNIWLTSSKDSAIHAIGAWNVKLKTNDNTSNVNMQQYIWGCSNTVKCWFQTIMDMSQMIMAQKTGYKLKSPAWKSLRRTTGSFLYNYIVNALVLHHDNSVKYMAELTSLNLKIINFQCELDYTRQYHMANRIWLWYNEECMAKCWGSFIARWNTS